MYLIFVIYKEFIVATVFLKIYIDFYYLDFIALLFFYMERNENFLEKFKLWETSVQLQTDRKYLTQKTIANAVVVQVQNALSHQPNGGRYKMNCESFEESKSCQSIRRVIW